jgi:hypothetical protein
MTSSLFFRDGVSLSTPEDSREILGRLSREQFSSLSDA